MKMKCLKVTGYSLLIDVYEKILPLPYITLYLNFTKTGAGRLEEFSPRQLTDFDIRLDLVASSVENHPGCVTRFPWHTATKLLRAALE